MWEEVGEEMREEVWDGASLRVITPLSANVQSAYPRHEGFAAIRPASASVRLHPRNILIHPLLQECLAVGSDVAGTIEQTILGMDECFWLT